jgi:hypothetical protein
MTDVYSITEGITMTDGGNEWGYRGRSREDQTGHPDAYGQGRSPKGHRNPL